MEVKLNQCDERLIEDIKKYLGDGKDSPNWEQIEDISIGMGVGGANQWNLLLWQGQQYWYLNEFLGISWLNAQKAKQ